MGSHWTDWPAEVLARLRRGAVIPAHPLALDADRKLDARRQRALSRYYLDAGAGGLAVGVHTTQFAIRDVGLYQPVLELAMRTASEWTKTPRVMIAGLAGRTAQAVGEAQIARGLGYHAGLLSLAAMKGASEDELIAHAEAIAREIPLVGFYLQPAVGGIVLPVSFWRRFAAIENVVAIKMAPFNRYRTLDVIRGVVEAGAADRIALYTGNDDHIVLDLVTPFVVTVKGRPTTVRIKGGLLGHWSVWVKSAVDLLDRLHAVVDGRHGSGRRARARLRRDRLQRRDLRRRQRLSRRDLRLPRDPAAAGPARRHLVPRSERNARAGPESGDRPRLRRLSAPDRRRLRARECRALACVNARGLRYRGWFSEEHERGR